MIIDFPGDRQPTANDDDDLIDLTNPETIPFYEVFEFTYRNTDGKVVTVKQTYEEGAFLQNVAEQFRSIVNAVGYSAVETVVLHSVGGKITSSEEA